MIRLLCSALLAFVIVNQYAYAQQGQRAKSECNCAGFQCGISNRAGRVVGGKPTGRLEYPWAVSLSYRGKPYCGATLVTDEYLVTAAHCISGINKRRVGIVLGSYNRSDTTEASREERKVGEWWSHPEFDRKTFNNDIGIIRLDKKVDLNRFVRPVCIAEANTRSDNYIGQKGIVIGWGSLVENGAYSDVLREVRVPIMSNDECKTKEYKPKEITTNMMCAGNYTGKLDACQGDTGGPLLHESKKTSGGNPQIDLIGVISWGQGCGRPGFPGVYTRLSVYTEFINKHIRNGCTCPRA